MKNLIDNIQSCNYVLRFNTKIHGEDRKIKHLTQLLCKICKFLYFTCLKSMCFLMVSLDWIEISFLTPTAPSLHCLALPTLHSPTLSLPLVS